MKRIIILLTIITAAMTIGCADFDDTANTLNPNDTVSNGTTTTGSNGSGILNLSREVTTLLAGGGWGVNTGTNANITLQNPTSIATDGTNLYVADSNNCRICKIVISTGVVTTLAGSTLAVGYTDGTGTAARFDNPYGIATDGTNLYVTDSDYNAIRKIVISSGEVTTLLASGEWGFNNGSNAYTTFNYPTSIATDGTNLYVADTYNYRIRKIVILTGEVTTLAGLTLTAGSTDGISTAARFNLPFGITTDGSNLYVADSGNNSIRKIVISSREVTTLAGSTTQGSTDGIGTAARFNLPIGITADGANLYVADANNHVIRKIVISTGEVTTLAGSTLMPGYTDGIGTAALFLYPWGIATDGTNLYVAESNGNRIRKIQ